MTRHFFSRQPALKRAHPESRRRQNTVISRFRDSYRIGDTVIILDRPYMGEHSVDPVRAVITYVNDHLFTAEHVGLRGDVISDSFTWEALYKGDGVLPAGRR